MALKKNDHSDAFDKVLRAIAEADASGMRRILSEIDDPSQPQYGTTLLREAIEDDFAVGITMLIEAGVDPNRAIEDGADYPKLVAPLRHAILKGKSAAAITLLNNGANADQQDASEASPLELAAWHALDDVVEALLQKGADPNAQNKKGDSYDEGQPCLFTPLHAALTGRSVDLLVAYGAAVDTKDYEGRTPLHQAAELNMCDAVRALVRHGADVNAKDCEGATPLVIALEHHSREVSQLLVTLGADVSIPNSRGQYPIHIASREGDGVNYLVQRGADVNVNDHTRKTPLHHAAEAGNRAACEQLLKAGANIHATDCSGKTPLFCAAAGGKTDVVSTLLNAGADPDMKDRSGMTPLHAAVRYGTPDCAHALLACSADVNATNVHGENALSSARELNEGQLASLLMDHGARMPDRSK